MNCQEVRTAIDGYVDGELDPFRNREIAQHLQSCAKCSQGYKSHQTLQAVIREGALYFKAPLALQRRIRSSLRQGRNAEPIFTAVAWRWVGIAASFAIVAILTWRFAPLLQGPISGDFLVQEVIAGHVRSLMVSHLVDIPSSDRHVVKPWFAGKLDFAPSVADLANQGFPLIGGRLDYLDNRAVAAVVYKRREHVINVFIWPGEHSFSVESKPTTHQGYHHLHWSQAGMTYWAISDLNSRELQEFVRLLQDQASR